jgi:hypothetical protein
MGRLGVAEEWHGFYEGAEKVNIFNRRYVRSVCARRG